MDADLPLDRGAELTTARDRALGVQDMAMRNFHDDRHRPKGMHGGGPSRASASAVRRSFHAAVRLDHSQVQHAADRVALAACLRERVSQGAVFQGDRQGRRTAAPEETHVGLRRCSDIDTQGFT